MFINLLLDSYINRGYKNLILKRNLYPSELTEILLFHCFSLRLQSTMNHAYVILILDDFKEGYLLIYSCSNKLG